MRKLPMGYDNFKDVIQGNFHYVKRILAVGVAVSGKDVHVKGEAL